MSKPIRIVHTGDCHLGYRQYGFNVREDDFEKAVEHVVDTAIKLKVDAMLWAGDIFDSPTPSARSVYFVYQMVDRLQGAGIKSIGIDGNHDASDGRWLRVCGIDTFSEAEPGRFGNCIPVRASISVGGLNYRRPRETAEDLSLVVNLWKSKGVTDIFLLHQPLGDMVAFGSEITAEWVAMTLKPLGVRYVALGDIHNFQLREMDGIMFAYPGSMEMTDIDEEPNKRFLVVEFPPDKAAKPEIQYHTIPTRKVTHYDIKTEADLARMLNEVKVRDRGFALPIITVDTGLAGGVERIQQALGGEIPHRLMRQADAVALKQKFSDPEWDRKGSIVDLKSAVTMSWPENTVEHQLIMELLAAPKAATAVARKFIEQKGVSL